MVWFGLIFGLVCKVWIGLKYQQRDFEKNKKKFGLD